MLDLSLLLSGVASLLSVAAIFCSDSVANWVTGSGLVVLLTAATAFAAGGWRG